MIFVVDQTTDVVTELAAQGIDTVRSPATFKLTANVENLTLIGAGAINSIGNALMNTFAGVAGEPHYIFAGANTAVEGDTSGGIVDDFQIQLNGVSILRGADFIL